MKWNTINGKLYIRQDGLSTLQAKKYILVINTGRYRSKVMQIIFHREGSIFITFPYFSRSEGIVSLVTVPPNLKGPVNLSVLEGGKATSHLVKYSYHPDGKAQFSQDGKIYTQIRKQCPSINEIEGPFFTARIQGLSFYEQFIPEKETLQKPIERTYVEAILEKSLPSTVKISSLIYQRDALRENIKGRMIGPTTKTRDRFNKIYETCVCSAPSGHISENINILLTCEIVPRVDNANEAHLSFMGGYDNKSVVLDITKETSFLFFAYPHNNIDELIQKIGTVDFRKSYI